MSKELSQRALSAANAIADRFKMGFFDDTMLLDVAQIIDDALSNEAAPDLLAALKLARVEMAGLPHSLGYEFTHLPKIDAAIAKATGATP